MRSKAIEVADYQELGVGTKALLYANARCLGGGLYLYYPHPHRTWEYASALTAYHEVFGNKDTQVLDIGCGHSALGPALALRTNAHVRSIDPDERLLKHRENIATKLYLPKDKITFEVGDLLTTEGTYDAVFCISVIEHIPEEDQYKAWEKLISLVKPGGLLFVTTDYGQDASVPWNNDEARVVKFDPTRMAQIESLLQHRGFACDFDLNYHGAHVFDYTFYRIAAVSRPSSGL